MVDIVDCQSAMDDAREAVPAKRGVPRWAVTAASLVVILVLWEALGRHINPIFGAPPSAIFVAYI